MIKRLRPTWSAEELQQIYATPHNHLLYGRGHGERVAATIALARKHLQPGFISVADLSCGNGHIARSLGLPITILGDFAPGYPITGPIEETIEALDHADVFVLSETLEHVDDPAGVLHEINKRTSMLVLSTPIDAFEDTNAEHYWAWDKEGVEELADLAGLRVADFTDVDSRAYQEPYRYGIWIMYN